jgi:hypothetical protein
VILFAFSFLPFFLGCLFTDIQGKKVRISVKRNPEKRKRTKLLDKRGVVSLRTEHTNYYFLGIFFSFYACIPNKDTTRTSTSSKNLRASSTLAELLEAKRTTGRMALICDGTKKR